MRQRDRTPEEIQAAGLDALSKALSPSEMMTFIINWPFGRGNYTEERHQLLEDGSVEDLVAEINRANGSAKEPA
jgi:hypothetical protein